MGLILPWIWEEIVPEFPPPSFLTPSLSPEAFLCSSRMHLEEPSRLGRTAQETDDARPLCICLQLKVQAGQEEIVCAEEILALCYGKGCMCFSLFLF